MEELARLANAAGAEVLGTVLQERDAPTPPLHFGRGKVEELKGLAAGLYDRPNPGRTRKLDTAQQAQLGEIIIEGSDPTIAQHEHVLCLTSMNARIAPAASSHPHLHRP